MGQVRFYILFFYYKHELINNAAIDFLIVYRHCTLVATAKRIVRQKWWCAVGAQWVRRMRTR